MNRIRTLQNIRRDCFPIKSTNSCMFHTSTLHNGQAKVMKKIMGETKKKSFKYRTDPLLPPPSTLTVGVTEGKKSPNSRRVNVLNKLFMRYVTDLMSAGEFSSAFVGHGIEINHVQVTSDFSLVRIYWSSSSNHDLIEDILNKNVGNLRHELSQLKVVGVVPRLQFVKDKQISRIAEVDKLLSQADYGDNHVPIDLTGKIEMELNPHENESDSMEKNHECDNLPRMPNVLFGLDHAKIMERIENLMKKSKGLYRVKSDEESSVLPNINEISVINEEEEREAFRQFLHKQQIMKNRMQKVMKEHRPALELVEERNQDFETIITEENDFLDEEDTVN